MPKPSHEDQGYALRELEEGLLEVGSDVVQEHDELFELSILCNISRAVASTMDLDKVLEIVIDEVRMALITEGAGVLLYDENRGDLYWREIRGAEGIIENKAEDLRIPLEGSIAGWVFKNNKAARVNDTSKDPRYYPDISEKTGYDISKVLQVPLISKDKTIGVLIIMNKIGGDFTDQDEALAISMAGSIGLAIENATVYEKLKKSRDDLEMIYRSSMALASTMDLDHLLEVVISELRTAMEVEGAGVLLYDDREGDLYWKEVQDEKGLLDPVSASLRLPLNDSISGSVYETGEPVLLNNPATDPRFFKPFETISGFQIRNEILVPLNTRDDTIGVLTVFNKKSGQFVEEDVHVCSSLAGVVAMAVENARFFRELLDSYNELEQLNKAKSKILNHLSHELRTPLAIIHGTLSTMQKRMEQQGVTGFEKAMERMNRHVLSLNRLESQVESIMMTGYSWQKRHITGFLQKALDLIDVQAEYTPEIEKAAMLMREWMEKTFPTSQDELELINIKQFSESVFEYIRSKADEEDRKVDLNFDLENHSRLLIPDHVLQAIVEGLVRNAIEATPDNGRVDVTGRVHGDRYIFKVTDTGIGIPEEDREFIFEGFYPVQDTDDYRSGRPYSFNAGGKGIDLLRIRMFSELYDFNVSFTSSRCPYLQSPTAELPGDVQLCTYCQSPADCANNGGSEFVVDFKLADQSGDSDK